MQNKVKYRTYLVTFFYVSNICRTRNMNTFGNHLYLLFLERNKNKIMFANSFYLFILFLVFFSTTCDDGDLLIGDIYLNKY